ncbi:MAG TPA: heparinase II/III family protein [Phnomibacter sp.]|nr:heparinase II/III family protein [Phnomibacter sp.]
MKRSICSHRFYKGIIISLLTLFSALSVWAHEYRDLLSGKFTKADVRLLLMPGKSWITYPAYTDRRGWDDLTRGHKNALIEKGEKMLSYPWKVVKATDYLEFERSGSRQIMESPMGENHDAFVSLLLAELAEGKGRFMDQLANGIWYFCDVSSWTSSAHLVRQKDQRPLPDPWDQIIDLAGGDMGAVFAWTLHFLKDPLDKVHPLVSKRLRHTLQERILDPYMQRDDMWWQAFHATPETMVNNWNPWCNFNVLTCILLLEEDADKRAEGVYRTMVSVDKFMNYNHADGACEEGPSYWGHAAGKMYDFLQLLYYATNGRISLFEEPMVRNMGEYIARSYVGNGWVVNFADASAKGGGYPGIIYRYGKAVNSDVMRGFAAYLYGKEKDAPRITQGKDVFRTFENMRYEPELQQVKPQLIRQKYTWYPQTQFCYMTNGRDMFFAAKGGYNAESHNHNDAGTFSLYVNEVPMLIDAGVGTYTRQTFSSERYSIWTMQSEYHNVPRINGASQPYGREYKASQLMFDPAKSTLSMELAGAYDKAAAVRSWKRTYTMLPGNALRIEDAFQLSELREPNALHFLTWARPDISTPGKVILQQEGAAVVMEYDSKQFEAATDNITLTDVRLSNVWGPQIYRLRLTARKQNLAGKYIVQIKKM